MDNREEQIIDYNIIYTKRRSIGIYIGPISGVTVRAPYRTSVRTIEKLVISKSSWIRKHLENHKSNVRIGSNRSYSDGDTVLFRGKEFHIRIIESKTYWVRLVDNIIEIGLRNITEKEMAGLMLEKWYRTIAVEIFSKKFEDILISYKNYNFTPSELSVRALKRRWGSCSSKGKITLSSELIKLDEIYLEYVIIHELCHLKHHDHGKEFYKLLYEIFPDWKQRRGEMKKFIR
jgi:predicted metal-dependent hydrolase